MGIGFGFRLGPRRHVLERIISYLFSLSPISSNDCRRVRAGLRIRVRVEARVRVRVRVANPNLGRVRIANPNPNPNLQEE